MPERGAQWHVIGTVFSSGLITYVWNSGGSGQGGIALCLKSNRRIKQREAAQLCGDALLFKGMGKEQLRGASNIKSWPRHRFLATFCLASHSRMLRFPKTGRPVPSGLTSDSPDTYWESKVCHLPAFPFSLCSLPLGRLCTSTSSLLECWLEWKGSALQAIPVALFLYNPLVMGSRRSPLNSEGNGQYF